MRNLLRRLFAKRVAVPCEKSLKKVKYVTVPANERLIIGIIFAIVALVGLIILEIVHLTLLGAWNSEVFAAITSIIGTILGVFISQKA